MQNIVTLGEINDALKFSTVTAAQLADMGFAPLDNKPICEALPTEQSRRLRNAKLYPAESIGRIRVALAKRLAAPASCLHQIQEPAVNQQLTTEQEPVFWYRPTCNGEMYEGPHHNNSGLGKMLRDEKPDEWKPLYAAPVQSAPAAVAVPDELIRAAKQALACMDGLQQHLGRAVCQVEADALRAALAATTAADVTETAAELQALRDVYEQARGVLRYDGIDTQLAIKYRDGLIEAIETVKAIDGGNWEPSPAAAPVVLPEPDAAVKEVMGLVSDWSMKDHAAGEAILDAHSPDATKDEHEYAGFCASEGRAAWEAIETKLRALLAGVSAPAADDAALPRAALERAHDWMDSQADGQSKGGHATFDLMMLREERDAARVALDSAPQAQADARDAERWREVLVHVGAGRTHGYGGLSVEYVLRTPLTPPNVMQGSVAQHFTKSIDECIDRAAIAAAKGE